MKTPACAILLGTLMTTAACGDRDAAVFRGVPFCSVEEPGVEAQFEHPYVLLTTSYAQGGDNEDPVISQVMSPRPSFDPVPYGYQSPRDMRVVIVQCDRDAEIWHPTSLAKEPGTPLPFICDGQRVMVDRHLEPHPADERDAALGIDSTYRFPVFAPACTAGRPVRGEDITLGQILTRLDASIDRYRTTHDGAMPPSMDALVEATHLSPLPPDPWGHPFEPRIGDAFDLVSRGPDGARGTDDDIEVLSTDGRNGWHIEGFGHYGVDHNITDDYRMLLWRRGVVD